MASDDKEWIRVNQIIERYFSDSQVLDVAELTNLIAGNWEDRAQ